MGDIQRAVVLLLLVTLCHNVIGQIPFVERCPDVKVVESFNLDRYMGVWYEHSKYPFIWEIGQKCQYAVYKNSGNNTVAVKNTGTFVFINRSYSVHGTGKLLGIGKLGITFRNRTLSEPNALILGTDYENWAVVYSCTEITTLSHTKVIWILTRKRIPSEQSINAAMEVIRSNNLREEFLIHSTQSNCPEVVTDDVGIQAAAASSTSEQQNNSATSSTSEQPNNSATSSTSERPNNSHASSTSERQNNSPASSTSEQPSTSGPSSTTASIVVEP